MPITKRIAHLGSPRDLIEYILDKKNYGEKVGISSSINCNVETALQEFQDIQKKFNMKGKRIAYHIIQSFSPLDNITAEQANEIGKRLCEQLYPNFQCVISTHIDRGHLHNHIALNSINLNGKKLEDRLTNEKEGLYALSDTSDRIAKEYGCYVMPRKIYKKSKQNDYYHQYKEQSFNEQIKEDLDSLIPKCNSLEELLDELSILGYEIKRGKYIAVKNPEMKKFARLHTIDSSFSNKNLYQYYKFQNNIKLLAIKSTPNEFNKKLLARANESKIAIEKSQLSTEGKKYSDYQKTKYQEIKRFYQLKQQLEYLDKYAIHSFEDIENQIESKRSQLKSLNIEFKKYKKQLNEIVKTTEKAQDYIRLYKTYEYACFYQKQDPKYEFPIEAKLFIKLQDELKINSVAEAKELIKNTRNERINLNKMKQNIADLGRELNHLDTIKEEKLSNSGLFIHNIKFGANRIDYEKSTDDCFGINLPYTNEKMYIPKKYTAYNEKYQYYTLYLVDDKEYEIFNTNDEKIGNITGTELEKYVLDKKKEVDQMYREF